MVGDLNLLAGFEVEGVDALNVAEVGDVGIFAQIFCQELIVGIAEILGNNVERRRARSRRAVNKAEHALEGGSAKGLAGGFLYSQRQGLALLGVLYGSLESLPDHVYYLLVQHSVVGHSPKVGLVQNYE